MPKIRPFIVWLALWAPTVPALAQDVDGELAATPRRIAAGQWQEALEALRSVPKKPGDRARIADALRDVGAAAMAAGMFEVASQAYEAAIESRGFGADATDSVALATELHNAGYCRLSIGQAEAALPFLEAALAMRRRIGRDADDRVVALAEHNLAFCLATLGRTEEALAGFERELAMLRRLRGDADTPDQVQCLASLGSCYLEQRRFEVALDRYQQALAMAERLTGGGDDPESVRLLDGMAQCLEQAGRPAEALPLRRRGLEARRRIAGDDGDPYVAQGRNNLAFCLEELGRLDEARTMYQAALDALRQSAAGSDPLPEAITANNLAACLVSLGLPSLALPHYERSLEILEALNGRRDDAEVARTLANLAACLEAMGNAADALPRFEQALAMARRIHDGRDDPDLAMKVNNLAYCFMALGRCEDALPLFEHAREMWSRLHGDRPHPEVALGLNNLAWCLEALGRPGEALDLYERVLSVQRALFPEDHPKVAVSETNIASCLQALGREDEALRRLESALDAWSRMLGDRAHPDRSMALALRAQLSASAGRPQQALQDAEQVLTMRRQLYGDRDHPLIVKGLDGLAVHLHAAGRLEPALAACRESVAMIERLRDSSRVSAELRQSLFDDLKGGGAYERLQRLAIDSGLEAESWFAAERSRGRRLLDLLAQHRVDALELATQAAQRRGDAPETERLQRLRAAIETTEATNDRLADQLLNRVDEAGEAAAAEREELLLEAAAAQTSLRQLRDERVRAVADVVPMARVETVAELQAVLRPGEVLLEYTLSPEFSALYVLAHEGGVQAIELPRAHDAVSRLLPGVLSWCSHAQLSTRGRDPDADGATASSALAASRELFVSLLPDEVWSRIRGSERVFLASHRQLHRLPFEVLVTRLDGERSVYWLDEGPPIAYLPMGGMLAWLRQRGDASDAERDLAVLALGDPTASQPEPSPPARGLFVTVVSPGGQGERVGLRPRDVILRYGDVVLDGEDPLGALRAASARSSAVASAETAVIPLEIWRDGAGQTLALRPGPLGIEVSLSSPSVAAGQVYGGASERERAVRNARLQQLRDLPPLRGARAEATAIAGAWSAAGKSSALLLGEAATERSAFELAAKARCLHFACHGIAEEYAGHSFSMLVLSRSADGDGLLQLGDVIRDWRGRLDGCRLVVLSACRTNVGPTFRDDAPQALPVGFLFAGARSVISSLWAVNDQSTSQLMTDLHSHLIDGVEDRLIALTRAKQALRKQLPDPFHWAPFLYIGLPE